MVLKYWENGLRIGYSLTLHKASLDKRNSTLKGDNHDSKTARIYRSFLTIFSLMTIE